MVQGVHVFLLHFYLKLYINDQKMFSKLWLEFLCVLNAQFWEGALIRRNKLLKSFTFHDYSFRIRNVT